MFSDVHTVRRVAPCEFQCSYGHCRLRRPAPLRSNTLLTQDRPRTRSLPHTLDRQRLRIRESFIYPVSGTGSETIWYLIHGGRTVAAIPEPSDREGAGAAAELIEAVYQKDPARLLNSYEHYDGGLLVASWFRRHPQQRKRTMPPAEALSLCRRWIQ